MLPRVISGIESVHFVGIGGIAMASVAAAMKACGVDVTGSDTAVYPPASDILAAAGIEPATQYDTANLALGAELVVIGNAISRGNPEAEEVLARRLRYCSLPELLREFFIRKKRALVVCGTHGKTTTSALLAWVLEHNGLAPSFLIGGMPNNFPGGARFTDSPWIVIEGDEYDTAFFDKRSKFVHYQPEVAILNNLEFDHADIFENLAAIQKSFSHLIRLVPRNGLVLANGDDPGLAPLLNVDFCPVRRFGVGSQNDLQVQVQELGAEVSVFVAGGTRFCIPLAGQFNVLNAAAVVACARHGGLTDAQIQGAFDTFKGVQRRMQIRGAGAGVTVIDDFAHHPTAIRETLRAARLKFPGQRVWAVFEPRSNTTRRSVFQKELAAALAEADVAVVAQVAALERLKPEDRLDPVRLVEDVRQAGRTAEYIADVPGIVRYAVGQARPGDVVAVLSNGGFGGLHEKLLDALRPEDAKQPAPAAPGPRRRRA